MDLSVAVVSTGRSGSNIALEILTGNKYFNPTEPPEDKMLFMRNVVYPDGYLTKCDAIYCRSFQQFEMVMYNNPHMKIIWTIRDPRDMCISKIRRGFERGSDDATFEGCVADMYHGFDLYKRAIRSYRHRIYLTKMENMIKYTETETKKMCKFLGIQYNDEMPKFYNRMRCEEKADRYGESIDKSQLEMYKNPEYRQVLFDYDINVWLLFRYMKPLIEFFDYGD